MLLYRRYVDDIIYLCNCEVDAMKFFDYLNSRHRNIKFTFEKQDGGKLALLDILIQMKMVIFVSGSFVKKHQSASTLTLAVLPLFRIRLD